jgi:transposase
MIGPTGAVQVMVATKPVDFRKGAEGLAALVRETMMADPFSGAVCLFRAKRAQQATFYIGFSFCGEAELLSVLLILPSGYTVRAAV